MKKFNYEEYKAGAKAVTRDGREVMSIYFHSGINLKYPISALIAGNACLTTHTKDGCINEYYDTNLNDLFLVDEKVWYCNVYKDYSPLSAVQNDTLDNAKKSATQSALAICKFTLTDGKVKSEIVEHYNQ